MLRQLKFAGRQALQYAGKASSLRSIATVAVDEEQLAARDWFARYQRTKISPQICSVTFSRSSGPGGQKVNKTSSKASLKLDISAISPPPPQLILNQLAASRYAADKGKSLVIQADSSRKQGDNKDECFSKLDELITHCCSSVIRKDASPEQLKKVEKLQAASNQKRLSMKKQHSAKKSSRRGGD